MGSSFHSASEGYAYRQLKNHVSEEAARGKKKFNTHLIINEEGQIISTYRKIHLFDVDLTSKGGILFSESHSIEKGNKIADPVYSPCGYLGLSISFDLRFPEMYRELVLKGA